MLRIDSVRSFVRSLFVREVEVPVVVVERVEVPVEVPVITERVIDREVDKPREYWVLHSHKPTVVATGHAHGATEFAALRTIFAMAGERVQFANGGRYRCHGENGTAQAFTRIDRASRATVGARERHRNRTRDNKGCIVGE